jgi:hypothetical protein
MKRRTQGVVQKARFQWRFSVPRYYFHVRHGRATIRDNLGVELADLGEATKEAARRAPQIARADTLENAPGNNSAIIVEDEYCTVLELPLTV